MILSKKFQILVGLAVVCMCDPLIGAEPNEPGTDVKFETRSERPPRDFLRRFLPPSQSTHFAALFVKGNWVDHRDPPIDAILETSSGKAMSPRQRDLLSNQCIQWCDNDSTLSSYSYFQIFGVTENDTEKMAEAFMHFLEKEGEKKRQSLQSEQQRLKRKMAQIEEEMLHNEREAKDVDNRLKEMRRKVHYLSAEEAQKAVEQLNRMLDELNIEIVGIRVKLEAIAEEHERTKADALKSNARQRSYEAIIWPRLEQMRIDEIIALKVAEAKKAAAARIRDGAEEFYNLSKHPVELENQLGSLRATLSVSQRSLEAVEHELAQTNQLAIPLKVFQSKVSIFPVAGALSR